MYETLLVEKKDYVATVTLNRPEKMNSFIRQSQLDIMQAMDELEADDEVRVVILTGAGKCFCAGFDLSVMHTNLEELLIHMDDMLRVLAFEKPLIAAVNGPALAQGIQLALACDIIIASEKATFGSIGASLGLPCNYAVFALPAVVGRNKAAEMLFTAEPISGEEAFRIGLATKVVPPEQLMPAAQEMADRIKKNAPLGLRYTKKGLLRAKIGVEFNDDTVNWLRETLRKLALTQDYKEGFKAAMERRKPVFTGK